MTILNSDQTRPSRQNLSFAFPVLVKLLRRESEADGKRLLLVQCVELSLVASFPFLFWSCSNLEFSRLLLFPFINNGAAVSSICTKVKRVLLLSNYKKRRKTYSLLPKGKNHHRLCCRPTQHNNNKRIFLKKRYKFSFEAESEIKWSGLLRRFGRRHTAIMPSPH